MDRDEFVKRSWKAYQTVLYQDDRMELPVECLLAEVDFDGELMTLQPLHEFFEQTDFIANIKYCSVPRRKTKMKIVK